VTAGYDGVTIWDAATGERTGGFTHNVKIFSPLCFAPDGRLFTGSDGATGIRIWDFPAGRLRQTLPDGGPSPQRMAISADGATLGATVDRSRVELWDLRTGKQKCDGGHSGPVRALCFSPDGRSLVSGASDASVRVWETERWSQQRSLVLPE